MREAMARVDVDGPTLLCLEHAPTLTTTRHAGQTHLLLPPTDIAARGIEVFETDRGGDVTFHGTGQLVGYPILRLGPAQTNLDLVGYVRHVECAILDALALLGVKGLHRKEGMTGVWVSSLSETDRERWAADAMAEKLVAIGVGVKGGVTRHGFALNLSTELERYTACSVPCGLKGRGVTSWERLQQQNLAPKIPDLSVVIKAIAEAMAARWQYELAPMPTEIPNALAVPAHRESAQTTQ